MALALGCVPSFWGSLSDAPLPVVRRLLTRSARGVPISPGHGVMPLVSLARLCLGARLSMPLASSFRFWDVAVPSRRVRRDRLEMTPLNAALWLGPLAALARFPGPALPWTTNGLAPRDTTVRAVTLTAASGTPWLVIEPETNAWRAPWIYRPRKTAELKRLSGFRARSTPRIPLSLRWVSVVSEWGSM